MAKNTCLPQRRTLGETTIILIGLTAGLVTIFGKLAGLSAGQPLISGDSEINLQTILALTSVALAFIVYTKTR